MTKRRSPWADALQETLANAVRAPYYRQRFGNRWRRVRSLDDLARLPLLDKATAIRHQHELVVGEAPPGFGIASSGTTRVDSTLPPLNVLTSAEEHDAIVDAAANEKQPGEVVEDPYPGWTLTLISVTHGLPQVQAGHDELLLPWAYDRNCLLMLEAVLTKPQPDGRRVTAMRISAGALKTFTAWLLERGRDPSTFGVKLIGTHSFRLSPFWRTLIERRFGAMLFDNYSLSEFATPATECKACGWLHFAEPPVIYEVLDLSTGKRKERGVGRLVLTGVYPYVQKMPLIRYDTGDVVELGPRCRATGRAGVRCLGRVRRGLTMKVGDEGVFFLNPAAVQDALESLPETERTPHPCFTLGHVKSADIGLPRWTVESEGAIARLSFEVRFDPLVYCDRARELEARVREDLLRSDTSLRKLTRAGRVKLEVAARPSRSLTPPPDKYD